MGLFAKSRRFVIATLAVGLDRRRAGALAEAVTGSAQRIVDAGGAFDTAAGEIVSVCELLLQKRDAWTHVASGGEVYDDEADAAAAGSLAFAEDSARYAADHDGPGTGREGEGDHQVVVVTVAYAGESDALEQPITSPDELAAALRHIIALQGDDQLLLAHLHAIPSHPEDRLDDERLLVSFPELTDL